QIADIEEPNVQPTHNHATRSKGPVDVSKILSIIELQQILSSADYTPNTFKQPLASPNSEEWKKSIAEEHQSLIDHGTFEVVNRPRDHKPITSMHIFKIKRNADGSIAKFKTRLVAHGHKQNVGENYFEVFANVVRTESIRFITATAVAKKFRIHHLDVQ